MVYRVIAGVVGAALAVGILMFLLTPGDRISAEDEIRTTLNNAATAYSAGKMWEVMSVLSPTYKDGTGMTRDQTAALLTRYRAETPASRAFIEKMTIAVTGGEAEVPLTVNVQDGAGTRHFDFTAHLRREKDTVFGFVPVQRWKVYRMDGLPDVE